MKVEALLHKKYMLTYVYQLLTKFYHYAVEL